MEKRAIIVTYIWEESGGTKKVIKAIINALRNIKCKVKLITVLLPSPNISKEPIPTVSNRYLTNSATFNNNSVMKDFNGIVEEYDPDFIFFILGNGYLNILIENLNRKYINRSILYYMDPWFTIEPIKAQVRKVSQKYISIRDKILSSFKLPTNALFKRDNELEEIVQKAIYNQYIFKNIYKVLTLSTDIEKFFIRNFKLEKKQIEALPLFTEKIKRRSKLNFKFENTYLYTGRVSSSWKGFGVLLEAMKVNKDFNLIIYTWDRFEAQLAIELLKTYEIDSKRVKIEINKTTKDIMSIANKVDGVIIPSIAEGFSFTMLEVMSVGGIVYMGAKFGGPKDVVINGYNGILFKPGNGKDLAQKISQKKSKFKYEQISKNAVKTSNKYGFDQFQNNLLRILKLK